MLYKLFQRREERGKGTRYKKTCYFYKTTVSKMDKGKNLTMITQKRKIINYTAFCFNFLQAECISKGVTH